MMGNSVKKLVASVLSLSFFSMQTAFGYQMTGEVLGNNPITGGVGAGGADIVSSSGGFQGFQNGGLLGLNKNEANLHFNGDAVINWGHLNVGSNQQLNFLNGNNVVLNNVTQGMSTFAGTITAQNGQIIISNPSGILLQGGKFETAGALMLTTKDLSGIKYTDLANKELLNEKINQAGYTNDYAVVAIKDGKTILGIDNVLNNSKIQADDIKIIAKGIDVKNADITASKGNIVFQTTDGATFLASEANKQFADHNVKFENGNTIQIANASIKTPNGGVQLITDKGNVSIKLPVDKTPSFFAKPEDKLAIKDSNVNGNLTIASPIQDVSVDNSKISGNLKVNSAVDLPTSAEDIWNLIVGKEDFFGSIKVSNSEVKGTTDLYTWGSIIIDNCKQIGNVIAESMFRNIDIADSHITGDANLKVTGRNVGIIPYYDFSKGEWVDSIYVGPKGGVTSTNTAIDGTITLNTAKDANFTSPDSLHFVNPNVGGTLTADAENVLSFTKNGSDLKVDKAFADKYKLTAGNELQFKTDKNLIADNSYGNFVSKLTSFFGKNVNLNNIKANSIKAVADNTVNANGIKVNTNNKWENILGKQNTVATFEGKTINSTNSSYNGEVVVNADNATFTQNDGNILKVMDSNISDTLKVTSNGEIYLGSWDKTGNNGEATKIGSLDLDSTNKITIWDTNVAEDALLKASNTIGIYDSEFNTANMTANNVTSSNTNYSSDIKVNADNATFNSKNNLAFKDSNVTNNFKAESNGIIDIVKSVFNKADLSADKVASRETNYSGNIKVNANEANFNSDSKLSFVDSVVNAFKAHSNNDVTIDKNSSVNTSDLKGNNVISNAEHKGTIKVEAENNAAFTSDKDLVFENPVFNGTFTASTKGDVTYNQNGNLTVDESIKLAGNNININAENITSNNAIYEGSVQMNSKGQIQFNNNNTIAGSLIAQAENDITMNGNTQVGGNATVNTTANAIVNGVNANGTLSIENAQNISVNNCSSDRLAIINTLENKFNYAEIFNSNANTTEFANGEYLYIDLTNSSLFNNNRQAIINSANNVDRIVIVPFENALGQEATKNMNNLSQKGVNTVLGSDFSPIAFAAHDTAKRSGIYKAAGDKIFRDTQDIVHITDRFDVDQY